VFVRGLSMDRLEVNLAGGRFAEACRETFTFDRPAYTCAALPKSSALDVKGRRYLSPLAAHPVSLPRFPGSPYSRRAPALTFFLDSAPIPLGGTNDDGRDQKTTGF